MSLPSTRVHGSYSPSLARKLEVAKKAIESVFSDTSDNTEATAAALDELSYEISNYLEVLRDS